MRKARLIRELFDERTEQWWMTGEIEENKELWRGNGVMEIMSLDDNHNWLEYDYEMIK